MNPVYYKGVHWISYSTLGLYILTYTPHEQNGCHFADDIFKRIFLNENVRIFIQLSLKFISKGPIDN